MGRKPRSPLAGHRRLAGLEKVKAADLREFRAETPGLPADYLTFLETVGFGSIESRYMIYGGPCRPSDFYDSASAAKLGDLVLFGDDFQGYCAGFDPKDRWCVVEVDPTRMATHVVASTFTEFLAAWLQATAPPGL